MPFIVHLDKNTRYKVYSDTFELAALEEPDFLIAKWITTQLKNEQSDIDYKYMENLFRLSIVGRAFVLKQKVGDIDEYIKILSAQV